MSLTLFPEPFYTLADFDRLFDEAFNARSSGVRNAGERLTENGQIQNTASRVMRPR